MVYAVVLFWLILGLVVFFVAMRRGGGRVGPGVREDGLPPNPRRGGA